METIRQTQIKYCSRAIIISITTGLFFLAAGLRDVFKGLLLGTLFSIIDFNLIGSSISCKFNNLKSNLLITALELIELRHVVLTIPIILAVFYDQYSLWAVILGLFSVQFVLILDHFSNYLFSIRNTKI